MASKEKRGKLPSIPLKEIGGFLDYNFNSCWGCGTELKVEGYVEDPDDLESRLDENTGITCWILRLRRALVHGGAKHDNGNRLPICFDCYLSGKDGTRRITLPGYMWRRLDIMCDHVKSVEGWEDTPTKAIQRAVIESSIGYYEPFRLNFNPVHPRDEEPAQTFVFEVVEVFFGKIRFASVEMTTFGVQCLRFKVQGSKVIVSRSMFSVYSLHCKAIQNSAFEIQNFCLGS